MADENRGTGHALTRTLLEEGHRFSFFQAVRMIQHLHPEAAPVGHQGPVERECIRFRPPLDLAFASSDVAGIQQIPAERGTRFEVASAFLSLYGAVSPLPAYYTEELFDAEEGSLSRGFLDLFHHRALSLFYRVWEKYRYAVRFASGGTDFYSRRLLALLGLDLALFPKDHRIPAVRLLAFAGLLTQLPRSAASVRGVLAEHFEGTPIDVEPFVGRWIPVAPDQENRLARRNTRLGEDLTLGGRVFDRGGTFRVGVGPVGLDDFMAFLPPGQRMPEMRELVDLLNSDGLDCEVELRLREEEVPPLQLSTRTSLLGWTTWLGRRPGMETRVRFLVKGWLHGRR